MNELTTKEIKKLIRQYFIECSELYFPDMYDLYGQYNIPKPRVVTKVDVGSVAMYKCYIKRSIYENESSPVYSLHDQSILVNKQIDFDEKTLRRAVFHETIHYYDMNENVQQSFENKTVSEPSFHSAFFGEYLEIINSFEGKGYVSEELLSDLKLREEYYVVELEGKNERLYARIDIQKAAELVPVLAFSAEKDFDTLRVYNTKSFILLFLPKLNLNNKSFRYVCIEDNEDDENLVSALDTLKQSMLLEITLDPEKGNCQ